MSHNLHHFRTLGFLFAFLFGFSIVLTASAQDATAAPQAAIYSDPQGLFTMPVPEGWTDASTPEFVVYKHDNGAVLTAAASTDYKDIASAKTAVIAALAPDLVDVKPTQSNDIPLASGIWTQDLYLEKSGKVTALISTYKDGVAYILLLQAPDIATTQAVTPDLNKVLVGYTVGKPLDLTTATVAPFSDKDLAAIDAYISDALKRFDLPGASVAIVLDGKVIFSKGYGVTSLEGGTPVDADTLFMIGSTTKSFTSLLAATLVDEGKLSWETPATELLPDFALSDAAATSKIRYRDLLNMSSGVPRYDIPMFIEEAGPERIQSMVAEAKLVSQPGEAFNYSNQMVALGGFAAAVASGGTFGPEIEQTYAQLLQDRVLTPIGMTRSTLDPAKALADANHAVSHTIDIANKLAVTPIDPSFERFASPVAPAGALWSSANDMSRYLITQMNLGVTPDGTRIVSEKNLQETHTPAIDMGGGSYGMGWMINSWNGLTLLEHGGGTIGFVSDFSYLQEPKLGVIVLANRSTVFNSAVRGYIYETAYGLEHTADARYTSTNESMNASMEQGLAAVTLKTVDEAAVKEYLGTYEHGAQLVYDKGLYVVTAYGRVPAYDIGQAGHYILGGALPGFGISLEQKDGQYTLTVGSLTDPAQAVTLKKQ